MNPKTFHKVSYGLYVISSVKGEQFNGQIANTVFQVTSEKPSIAICINKQNLTHEFIHESKVFTVSILPKETPMNFIGNFGFKSGREIDKFKDINFKVGKTGAPIVLDNTLGNIEAKIIESVDVETHTLYIGRVVDAEITDDKEPMTYAYYHEVKRGTAPKAAPTYIEPDAKVVNDAANYRCSICGYIYDPRIGDSESGIKPGTPFEALPESWVCPVCGAKKDKFVKQI